MSATATHRPESAQLDCPSCGTGITYYDVEGSEFYACPNCHAYFRWSGEETPKVFGSYKAGPQEAPLFPLGALGTLADQRWRVVGFVERCELRAEQYRWTEYQLFQPETAEYAQLAQYRGHWMLVRPAREEIKHTKLNGRFVTMPDGTYRLYNRYQARVLWAVGEFDWDIEGDDRLKIAEFILPPQMLVQEKAPNNTVVWYRAEHVEPREVASAFNLRPGAMPPQEGVGAIQPDPVKASWPALSTLTTVAFVVLLLLQIGQHLRHPDQLLLKASLQVLADTTAKTAPGTGRVIVSPSFTLDHQAALQIDLTTTLNNQWLELPVSLVNEQTGQGFEFTKNIEFYNGVEGGESWTEGSRDADAVLSRVPAGRYHLNFYPFTEAGPAAPSIEVRVTADPPLWSNFFVVLLLLLVFPAWQYFRRASHETQRWSQSDYGPDSE
ncbi:DUF4178 domain-containing protein [Hymenobacter sp. 5317J-9]|uniref:DUF4178 domain-containing protein n=1 Tax=Hymenobacter sp. 5317J-9 TaxID=2932250 RepID=UPI001FD6E915|nr:DUF4178 domain-containing protein [Hymenobacter sp. 5317J-9]UOQ96266.1 DUF4178 domain-containing protein [Hymenobacter sp. 5317J-9]